MPLPTPVNKYSKETMITKAFLNDSSEYISHHSISGSNYFFERDLVKVV